MLADEQGTEILNLRMLLPETKFGEIFDRQFRDSRKRRPQKFALKSGQLHFVCGRTAAICDGDNAAAASRYFLFI